MGWLSGWTYRIELTIDSAKVDSDLTDFPVMINVPSAVFNRFSGDSDRKKIAVTTSDGTTQCYVEIEYWDHASTKGFLHTKISSILAASDTTICLYYDPSQSENTTYVGDTGDAAAQTVWNSGWALVYHCAQDPSGGTDCVLDSTPNENHGTPKATDGLTHITGLVGKAYQGDGSAGAYIEVPHHASLEPTHITIELVAKSRSAGTQYVIDKKTDSLSNPGSGAYQFGISSVGSTGLSFTISDGSSANRLDSGTDNVFRNQDAWAKVNLFYENLDLSDNDQSIDVDITEKSSDTTSIDMSGSAEILRIMNGHTDNKFIGDLCELRISSVARSAAWRKAAYYTLFNTLLTYGSEEEEEASSSSSSSQSSSSSSQSSSSSSSNSSSSSSKSSSSSSSSKSSSSKSSSSKSSSSKSLSSKSSSSKSSSSKSSSSKSSSSSSSSKSSSSSFSATPTNAIQSVLNALGISGVQSIPGGCGMQRVQRLITSLDSPLQRILSSITAISAEGAHAVLSGVNSVESTDFSKGSQVLLNRIGDVSPNIIEVNETGSLKRNVYLDGATIINSIDSLRIRYSEDSIHNSVDIVSYDKDLFYKADPETRYGQSRITVEVGTRTLYFLVEKLTGTEERFTIFGRSLSARDDFPFSDNQEVVLTAKTLASQIASDVLNYNSLDWQTVDWNLPEDYTIKGTPIEIISDLASKVEAIVRSTDDGTIVVRDVFKVRPIYMQTYSSDVSYDRVDNMLTANFSYELGTNESEVEVIGRSPTTVLPIIEVEPNVDSEGNTLPRVIGTTSYIRVYWVNEKPKILGQLVTDGTLHDLGEQITTVEPEILAFENGEARTSYPVHSSLSVSWIGQYSASPVFHDAYSDVLTGTAGTFAVGQVSYNTAYRRYSAVNHNVIAILAAVFLDETAGIYVKVKMGDGGNIAEAITEGDITSIEAAKRRGIAYLDLNKYNMKTLFLDVPYDDDATDGNIAYINDAEIACMGNFAISSSHIKMEGPKIYNTLEVIQCQAF